MHLADGIVSHFPTLVALNAAGAGVVAYAVRRSTETEAQQIAWAGTLGAFVLAAQAVNVPLVPGASAHVIGAGLLTLVLGPWRAILTMAAVLIIQAVFLADGGLTVLGANVVTIAAIPCLTVHATRSALARGTRLGLAATVGVALGNALGAAVLAAVLVYISGAPRWTFGWLVGVQSAAGVIEGLLTATAVSRLRRYSPTLFERTTSSSVAPPVMRWALLGAVLVAACIPFASELPDALEVVVTRLDR